MKKKLHVILVLIFEVMDDGDCVYMADLIDDVQTVLDMAFEYVMFDKDYDSMDIDDYDANNNPVMHRKLRLWGENRDVMINNHHSTQTATLYGIF